jgi:hypothetical protein
MTIHLSSVLTAVKNHENFPQVKYKAIEFQNDLNEKISLQVKDLNSY